MFLSIAISHRISLFPDHTPGFLLVTRQTYRILSLGNKLISLILACGSPWLLSRLVILLIPGFTYEEEVEDACRMG